MARINLLPWRQEERLRKNKEFNVVLGAAALVAALGVGVVYMFFNGQLEAQNQANAMIETENARLDKVNEEIATLEQQREEMISRMKLIQDLQGKRSIPVRVWDDIARAIPSAMYLVRINRSNDTITIEGFADNANVVSQLVRNLDASPWLADSRIPKIQSKIEAYQNVATKSKGRDDMERAPYPEDNYIGFTITTQVKSEIKTTEGEAGQNNGGEVNQGDNVGADQNQLQPQPTDMNQPIDPNAPVGQVADTAPAVPPAPTDVNAPPANGGLPAPVEPVAQQPVAPAPVEPVAQPQPVPPAPAPAPAGGQ